MEISRVRSIAERELALHFNLEEFPYGLLRQGEFLLRYLQEHIRDYITCKKDTTIEGCKEFWAVNLIAFDSRISLLCESNIDSLLDCAIIKYRMAINLQRVGSKISYRLRRNLWRYTKFLEVPNYLYHPTEQNFMCFHHLWHSPHYISLAPPFLEYYKKQFDRVFNISSARCSQQIPTRFRNFNDMMHRVFLSPSLTLLFRKLTNI